MNKILSLAIVSASLLVPFNLQAADAPPGPVYNTPNFTNSIASAGTSTRPNSAHVPIDIPPHSVMLLQATLWAADSGTSNLTASLNTTLDSTKDWTSTAPYTAAFTLNGTNHITQIVIVGTNLSARFASLDKWTTTQTNAVTVTNVLHSFIPIP